MTTPHLPVRQTRLSDKPSSGRLNAERDHEHGLGLVRPQSDVHSHMMAAAMKPSQGLALSRSGRSPARMCSFSAASPSESTCITT